MSNTDTTVKRLPARRRQMAQRGPLAIDPSKLDPNFHHYWALSYNGTEDDPNIGFHKEQLGYEIAPYRDVNIGDETLTTPSKMGSAITVQNKGSGGTYILMRTPNELWEQGQREITESTNAQDRQITSKRDGLEAGKLDSKIDNDTI